MQKYILMLVFTVFVIVLLPEVSKAQWTQTPSETYRMNDLIRRTPKKKATHQVGRKTTPKHQSKAARKAVRRKTRRVAQHIDVIDSKFKFIFSFSKKNEILV